MKWRPVPLGTFRRFTRFAWVPTVMHDSVRTRVWFERYLVTQKMCSGGIISQSWRDYKYSSLYEIK